MPIKFQRNLRKYLISNQKLNISLNFEHRTGQQWINFYFVLVKMETTIISFLSYENKRKEKQNNERLKWTTKLKLLPNQFFEKRETTKLIDTILIPLFLSLLFFFKLSFTLLAQLNFKPFSYRFDVQKKNL